MVEDLGSACTMKSVTTTLLIVTINYFTAMFSAQVQQGNIGSRMTVL